LQAAIENKDRELTEAKKLAVSKARLVESKEIELKAVKESAGRKELFSSLLKTLNKEKAGVMSELLESVQTDKLQFAFDKYLPSVLNGANGTQRSERKVALTEGRKEMTGNKTAQVVAIDDDTNVIDLKRLAGL